MNNRMRLAKQKGCDGLEPDNMDAYQNDSGFDLSEEDQLAFNKMIANQAHRYSLTVGLKNDLDQIDTLVNYYDFSVNEQCHEFNECDKLQPFTAQNKPIFNAEYLNLYKLDQNARNALCSDSRRLKMPTLILPLELDDSYRDSCI